MIAMTIAIDPGKTGAIAIHTESGTSIHNMPPTPQDQYYYLRDIFGCLAGGFTLGAIIEDVGYHVKGNDAQTSATFARHVGHLEAFLISLGIEPVYVSPEDWMTHIGVYGKYKKKDDRKTAIWEAMKQRYPHLKVKKSQADALGLLTYHLETQHG